MMPLQAWVARKITEVKVTLSYSFPRTVDGTQRTASNMLFVIFCDGFICFPQHFEVTSAAPAPLGQIHFGGVPGARPGVRATPDGDAQERSWHAHGAEAKEPLRVRPPRETGLSSWSLTSGYVRRMVLVCFSDDRMHIYIYIYIHTYAHTHMCVCDMQHVVDFC